MRTFDRLADLPLELEEYELEGLERTVSSGFTRLTTVVRLRGGGHEGIGEDVTYGEAEQRAQQGAGPRLRLSGSYTLATFSARLAEIDLFPAEPSQHAFRDYRRWGFESAALDLALRQEGRSLAETVGREARPVTFVVSMRLADPPSADLIRQWLELYPNLRFKLDPTADWDERLVEELRETGAVDSVDLKGAYSGTVVDNPADPKLYRLVAEGFSDAWIEDPVLTSETRAILEPHRERITWDAVIHSVADIEVLPFPPRTINVKPSRFGSLAKLCDAYDYCDEHGIGMYGGGQFELGPGRGQTQYLASLFHSEAPNDVAPVGFNEPEPRAGLPQSPLPPSPSATGFGWSERQA